MKELTLYAWIALILVLIGGINMGLIGLFRIDVLGSIFGVLLGRLIYIIIGVGAGYLLYLIYVEKTKKPT